MRIQRIVSSVLLAFVLLTAGCATPQPDKFADKVRHWVPIGTSAKDAEHIMTRKGFECRKMSKENPFNPDGVDCLRCDRDNYFLHNWTVKIFLEDGKVSGYGPVSIDDGPIGTTL